MIRYREVIRQIKIKSLNSKLSEYEQYVIDTFNKLSIYSNNNLDYGNDYIFLIDSVYMGQYLECVIYFSDKYKFKKNTKFIERFIKECNITITEICYNGLNLKDADLDYYTIKI